MIENYNIEAYNIVSKILLGTTFKIIFQNSSDDQNLKILEFTELMEFTDVLGDGFL